MCSNYHLYVSTKVKLGRAATDPVILLSVIIHKDVDVLSRN